MSNMSSKKIVFLIVSLLIVFISALGITYAILNYSRVSNTKTQMVAGKLELKFADDSNGVELSGAEPISDEAALQLNNNYFDFSVEYLISDSANINYSIFLEDVTEELVVEEETEKLDSKKIKFAIKDLDSNQFVVENKYFSELTDETINGFNVYNRSVNGNSVNHYRLYMWIPLNDSDDNVIELGDITSKTIGIIVNVKATGSVNK